VDYYVCRLQCLLCYGSLLYQDLSTLVLACSLRGFTIVQWKRALPATTHDVLRGRVIYLDLSKPLSAHFRSSDDRFSPVLGWKHYYAQQVMDGDLTIAFQLKVGGSTVVVRLSWWVTDSAAPDAA